MNFLFFLLLIVLIFLEGAITILPLTLIFLICLTIIKKDWSVFLVAFLAGLLLDLLRVHVIGMSSLFFIIFVFLILLYTRKYEINSYQFVGFASFLGSLIYLIIFGYGNWFLEAFISSIIAVLLFGVVRKFLINT